MCPTDLRKEKKINEESKEGKREGRRKRVYKTNTGPQWNHPTKFISLGEFKEPQILLNWGHTFSQFFFQFI